MPLHQSRLLARVLALAVGLGLGLQVLAPAAPAAAASPGTPLSGTVTTSDGMGVDGVVVTVRDADRDVVVATATTNADGEYAVAEIGEGYFGVLATPPADDPLQLATAFEPIHLGGADQVVDLELEISNVRGVVSRSDGSPAPGARVAVTARGHQEAWAYPDGSYRLALPRGGPARLWVSPPADNPALDVPRARTVDVAEDGVTVADLTLSQPNLRGRVLAPDGATSVAGASVQVVSVSGHTVANLQMSSRSDGSYGFHVPEGTWRLLVAPPVDANPDGWVESVADGVQITADHTPDAPAIVDVMLDGPTVTGVVRTPDGDPVPRARIAAYSEAAGSIEARSDAQGRYGLDLPAGMVQIDLRSPTPQSAYLDRSFNLDVPEVPYETDLVFGRPNVVGRVLTADGLPVRGAVVLAYGPDGLPEAVRAAATDRQGRFGLLLEPGTTQRVVADPPAGFPDGVRTGAAVAVPGGDGAAEVELVLDRPTPPSYDVVPLEVSVGGRSAVRSTFPVISADGTVVALRADVEDPCDCEAGSGLPSATSTDPAGDFAGIVLHDNITGEDEPLLAPNGEVIDTYRLELSGDGQRIAFLTTQSGLVEGDDDFDLDAFVLDRPSNTLHRLAQPDPRPWSGPLAPTFTSDNVALSADGSRLVLSQQGGDDEGIVFFDIAVVELGDGGAETSREVVDVKGRSRTLLDLSSDGSTLAWSEFDNAAWGLHVLDLATGAEDAVRPFSDGVDVFDGVVDNPSLSDDGRFVAYDDVSFRDGPGSSVVAGVRLADRATGTDRAVGLFAGSGGPRGDGVDQLELSGDGRSLLVLSPGGQPEEERDQAWLVDLTDDRAELVSRTAEGRPAQAGVDRIDAPSDFSVLALETRSEDLTGTRESFVALALGEIVPPEWPEGATLGAAPGGIGTTTVRLQWSEATDNAAVTGYRVFRGGELVGVTRAATRRLDLTGLTPDTSYTFTVQAVDARGSLSTDGPSATVRTLPEDSTELRPLTATARPGGADLSWEAARGVDQLLVRTYLGDAQVDERALDAAATSAQLRGLAAETAYTFQVFARTGETVRAYTDRDGVTTPSLSFTSLSWTVPTVRPDVAEHGSTATITAVAEPRRQVSVAVRHLSWYDDDHRFLDTPRAVTSIVPLAESDTPGTYTGGFELVDGVARIETMVGTVSDGHGHELDRASTRGPIRVSSRVVVTVDAPAGSLPGGYLQLTSQATEQWASLPVTGAAVVTLDQFRSATDVVARVLDERGRVTVERTDLAVRDGIATAITVRPALPATLTVAVRRDGGGTLYDAWVELRDDRTGDLLGTGNPDTGGDVAFAGLQEGQRVQVRVRYPSAQLLVDSAPAPITLDAGANSLQVQALPVPRTRLSGVVRDEDGAVVSGAQLTISQRHGTQTVGFSATTDAAGHYEVTALGLPGHLSAWSGQRRAGRDVDLSDGPVTRDLTLAGPQDYVARLRFFTRAPGAPSETGPVAIDWRTFVDLGMSITVDGQSRWFGTPRDAEGAGAPVAISAAPGQVVEWCVNGRSGGLAPACTRTTLGVDRTPVLELHAASPVPVQVGFTGAEGLGSIASEVHRLVDGERDLVAAARQWNPAVTHSVPGPGTYVLEARAGDRWAEREFSVAPTDTGVDLGTVALRRRAQFGDAENAVVASRSTLLPGGVVDLRASWRIAGTGAENVVARLAVPSGTTLVPDSLLLDGRPVSGAASGGYVEVPLGNLVAGATGSLRYQLRADAGLAGRVAAEAELRFGPPASRVAEPLRPAMVTAQGVTITGPDATGSHVVPLSGRGPAGQVVAILDGGVPVAQALVGPGGFWSSKVTLVEQERGRTEHRVSAETVVEGQRVFAEHTLQVDATRPVPTGVSLYQLDDAFPNGRRFDFDPREGVARFPFVFVPGQRTVVEVTFDEPSLVSGADVLVGTQRFPATRQASGMFRAVISESRLSGPIRIDYDAIAKPLDMAQPEQAETQIRDNAPAPLQGFEVSAVAQPDPSGSGPRVGSFTSSIPSVPGASVRSTLTVTREQYTPTADDIAMQRATGSPAYGVTSTRSGDTLSYSMVVPLSEIPGLAARAERDGTPLGRALAERLRAAAGPSQVERGTAGVAIGVARVGYEVAFNATTTLDSLLSAIGAGDKYQNLSKAVDLASGCGAGKAAAYIEQAQNISYAAAAGDIAGALFNIGAVVFGPATFGLGTVALGVLGWAMDKAIGYAIDQATQSLVDAIAADDDCKDDEEDDEDDDLPDPVADPVWIYDPSGYVYEGARSARVGGVRATLLSAPSADGPWSVWDAEWFGQSNPQVTDDAGRYGWDVPEGWWKVAFTKDGYRPAYSRVLRVLPPHLDVDVSLEKLGFPHVAGSVVRDGRLEVMFDRLVRSASAARSLTVVDSAGAEVPGAWTAIGATTGEGDLALQRGLRFTPTAPLPARTQVAVTVDGVADYAGRLMSSPYSATLTVPSTPGGGPGPVDPPDDPVVPDAPTAVVATPGERKADVSWAAPDDGGADLLDYVVTALPSGQQVTVDAADTTVEIAGLAAGTAYTFTVTARNEVGSSLPSSPSAPVVPTALAPETTLVTGPAAGAVVPSRSALLGWAASGSAYVCRLDGRDHPCSGTELSLTGLSAGTHTFTVAAQDGDGDVDPTPASRTWTVPRDDRTLSGRGWSRRRDAAAFLGTYSQASRRGAALAGRVRGAIGLALVVTTGRGSGRAAVFLDGERLRTVRLAGSVAQHRRVVPVATFETPRSGTVRVVVTSRHGAVRIDGLGVTTG